MFEILSIFPFPFWVVIALLSGGVVWSIGHLRDGIGLPMLAVLGTVGFWYLGDAYYNDYANNHAKLFESGTLQSGWWQVAWFIVVFLVATPPIHRWINARHLHSQSGVLKLFQFGIGHPDFQRQLKVLFGGCLLVWFLITLLAAIRLGSQIPYFFFPFLGYKAEPWGRERIGSGFSAVFTVIFYFQMMVATTFGVVAAVSNSRRTRSLALIFCLVSWPYFIFDRTRNTMLAVVVPTMLSYIFLRLRGGYLKKLAVLGACFLLVNAWMAFVIANRSNMTMGQALKEKGFKLNNSEKAHHEGLNMFEELCWVNTLIANGKYNPNWGSRYFAELVNPIPRVIWPGKPLIGIDYAIARGQAGGGGGQADVFATVSTGCIGQGVVNFGRILGSAAAALLFGFWVAILARQDLHILELGRLPLYACGLILTFNLGRDITFLTLYPFVFGCLVLWGWNHYHPRRSARQGLARGRQVLQKNQIFLGHTAKILPVARSGRSSGLFRSVTAFPTGSKQIIPRRPLRFPRPQGWAVRKSTAQSASNENH